MAAGLLLCACAKENGSGTAEGTPVMFSASTVETRTAYSGIKVDDYERINWTSGDQIKVYCPQASSPSSHEATYTIGGDHASGKQSEATSVTSSTPLQWGSDTHRFYGVYPASASLSVSGTTATMSGSILESQTGSPALSSVGYMFAYQTESNPGRYQKVDLAFKPLFNAITFSLKAGDSSVAKQLSSIVLSSDNYLAGPFTASWSSATATASAGSSSLSKSITMTTTATLSTTNALTVTFITMPITQTNLKLTMNFNDGSTWQFPLKNGGSASTLNQFEKLVFGEISVPKKIVHVTGVTLNHSALNMTVGGADQTLTATVAPTDATDKSVSWSSSNTSVATVTNGVVQAVGAGTATITVTTTDGSKTATCTVTVTQPVSGVSVSPTSATLNVGGTQQLTATVSPSTASNQNVTWSSSNTSVATVSNTGLVTAVATGTATISVTTADGSKTATCAITVIGVSLNKSSTKLKINATETLTATVTPSGASTVTWSSSDTSVATVSESGKITAKATGTATITARVDGGATATCTVTVISVSLNKSTLSMTVGGSNETLTATVTPSGASSVSWSTSNSSVATVSGGTVHAEAAGTATITATVEGGATATCTVTVTAPATDYTITFKGNPTYITNQTIAASDIVNQGSSYTTGQVTTTWPGMILWQNSHWWYVGTDGFLNTPSSFPAAGASTTTISIPLSSQGQVKAKSIELVVKWSSSQLPSYQAIRVKNASPNESIVGVSSSSERTLTFAINASTNITQINISVDYTRFQIKSIKVKY